jgi:hypothetical protein
MSQPVKSTGAPVRFWAVVFAMLVAMAAVQFLTARQESQIYDESNQLLSGFTYLKTGHFTMGLEQPPLLKLLWALPVAVLHPYLPPASLIDDRPWQAGRVLLYHNRIPADAMLMAGRCSAIAISVLLGFAIAWWSRRHFGAGVALLATFLYVSDPNFLANGRYIKNDVGAALLIFATVMTWGAYLLRPSRKALVLSGVVLGLAMVTKFSALMLPPLMLVLYGIRRWQERRGFDVAAAARALVATGLVAFVVIFAVYRLEVRPLGESGTFRRMFAWSPHADSMPVPALAFFRGIGEIEQKQTEFGLDTAYLLGQRSKFGWWYSSPVALAVKTPIAELALFALTAGLALWRLRRTRLRDIEFHWFLLTVPPATYFAVSLVVRFNAGMRHLLPLYPFLFVFAAAMLLEGLGPRWRGIAAVAGAALLALESASIHPHYLAFFNLLAGGPAAGQHILVDSNLDWGQDLKNLKSYMAERQIPEVCISYFGMAEPDYYGVHHRPLPPIADSSAARDLDCVAAISATRLALERERYAGLADLQPDARIGYSIYVYDLRKPDREVDAAPAAGSNR